MKKIIATIIFLITLVVGLYGTLGDIHTGIDLLNATSPAMHGDYQNSTNNVVTVVSQYMVDAVYFAIIIAFVGIIIGVLKKF